MLMSLSQLDEIFFYLIRINWPQSHAIRMLNVRFHGKKSENLWVEVLASNANDIIFFIKPSLL